MTWCRIRIAPSGILTGDAEFEHVSVAREHALQQSAAHRIAPSGILTGNALLEPGASPSGILTGDAEFEHVSVPG